VTSFHLKGTSPLHTEAVSGTIFRKCVCCYHLCATNQCICSSVYCVMHMLVSHLSLSHASYYRSPLILYLTQPLYKQMKSKHCVEYLIDQRVIACVHILECELEGNNTIIIWVSGVPKGGGGVRAFNHPPPRNSEGPPKSCQT